MYRFSPSLIILVPQDSNIALYVQVCGLCCMLYMPLFGLVQVRSWFRSSMWILSVACISKILWMSEVAHVTRNLCIFFISTLETVEKNKPHNFHQKYELWQLRFFRKIIMLFITTCRHDICCS